MRTNSKIVAYLDILGFTERINDNIQSGAVLLGNYQTILQSLIIDQKFQESRGNSKKFKDYGIDSFDLFLPFSDSIFIQASNAPVFVKQLSNFLIKCFEFTANSYRYPEDAKEPQKVSILSHIIKEDKLTKNYIKVDWWPLLFRGGIGYNESYVVEMDAIVDSDKTKVSNIIGKAVVDAYSLESKGKGPRLFCNSGFYDQLNEESKEYCRELGDSDFEILWPAFNFIKDNTAEFESNKITSIMLPVINLFKAHKNKNFGMHYEEFLKLTIRSIIRFFEIKKEKELKDIKNLIWKILESCGIDDLLMY